MPIRRFITPGWRWFVIAFLAVVVVVPPLRHLLESGINAVSQPLMRSGQTFNQRFDPGLTLDEVVAERDALRDQVEALTSRLAEAQQKLEISSTVEELTAYIGATRGRSVIAGVIGYSPDPGITSIVISRGSADGVAPGMAVVTSNGILIGKVRTVTGRTATVVVLTDNQSQVAARIQNDNRSPGIINGERGLAMVMNFIPKDDDVKPGQTIVTSGTEALVPPDVVIGTVRATSSRTGDLFLRATVLSPIELNRVRAVAVLIIQT